MAKVFGVHYIALKLDVAMEEFEAFMARAASTVDSWPGVQNNVAKGERGDRVGRLAYIVKFESVEIRNHYLPVEGGASDEGMQRFSDMGEFIAEWERYATFGGTPILWTDYVVIAEI